MDRLVQQCRKPTGWFGAWTAWGMNIGHARVTAWGLAHVSIAQDATILDVGCGGGGTVRRLATRFTQGKVYGIDLSEESVAVSRRTNRRLIRAGRVEIQPGSVSHLPFAADMFDLATAIETHYFWPDLVADMREILRVLKPGGRLLIMGEAYKGGKYEDRNRKWVEAGQMAYHSKEEFGQLFSLAGYADVQVFEEYDKGWLCSTGTKPS